MSKPRKFDERSINIVESIINSITKADMDSPG
jgi:hypothetical protein